MKLEIFMQFDDEYPGDFLLLQFNLEMLQNDISFGFRNEINVYKR